MGRQKDEGEAEDTASQAEDSDQGDLTTSKGLAAEPENVRQEAVKSGSSCGIPLAEGAGSPETQDEGSDNDACHPHLGPTAHNLK